MATVTDITADAKLGPVLDRWPELKRVLVALSPRFRLLDEPLVRRTLGRVATLRQVPIGFESWSAAGESAASGRTFFRRGPPGGP